MKLLYSLLFICLITHGYSQISMNLRMRLTEPSPRTVQAVARQLLLARPGARRLRILELSAYWPRLLAKALELEHAALASERRRLATYDWQRPGT